MLDGYMSPEKKQTQYIECPFCSGLVEPKIGKMKCYECKAQFEYSEKEDLLFADLDDLRLPVSGTVCSRCGLLQSEENRKCAYCGTRIYGTVQ
jgi:DNA-directed RNA polymerase subunit RPC12/RpoP